MARIKITEPKELIYKTRIPVLNCHINYGGHVGNDSVLSLCQEARCRFFASFGLSELDIGNGAGTIMVDAMIDFLSEAYQGQELEISIGLDEFTRSGFRMYYLIKNIDTGKEMAKAATGIVSFNYITRKVVTLPEGFTDLFNHKL